jgi:hypothetical protein
MILYGKDGTQYQAHSSRSRIDVSSMEGFGSIAGLGTVRLADGTPLNVIDENTFQNVLTDEVLLRIPPKPESR